MKNKLAGKYLSILLVLVMVFSIFPTAAFADEPELPKTVEVNLIAARDSFDGWVVLYPEATGTTQVTVPYTGVNPTVLDVVKAVDPNFDGQLSSNRPVTFLGHSRASEGYGNWMGARLNGDNIAKFTTATVSANESIIIYLPFGNSTSGAPAWDALLPLIQNPSPVCTPEQRLERLLAAELTFDKIKGDNASADSIKANLGSLPGYLDGPNSASANISMEWTSGNTRYLSNSGVLQMRPKPGEEPINVTMTAKATIGGSYNAKKYGDYPDLPRTVTFNLTIQPFTEEELAEKTAEKTSVDQALASFVFKYFNNDSCDPSGVLRSIWLNTSSLGGVSGVNAVWTSSNTDAIKINSAQGIVTRPAPGKADATVNLTVTAYKNLYSDSKTFTVTVPAVTQAELDDANAELDAVAAALTFDVIKKQNVSADAVTSGLQMAYRGLGYPGPITWQTVNNGYNGVGITWETSDSSAVTSSGTLARPTAADKSATLTATLKLFRLEAYVEPRTVEIPVIVRKVSHSADVASITVSPSMGLKFDAITKSYDLAAPAIADSVAITVKTKETGTLITSGQQSARGTLSFEAPLITGSNTVTISTQGLDTPANTDLYTLNITRETLSATDTAVSELIESLSAHYTGTDNDWAAVSMSAYGKQTAVAGKSIVENARGAYINGSMTDLERKIIALTALGINAAKVRAGELFADDYLDFVTKLGGNYSVSQTTEAIFGLIALDSGNYSDDSLTYGRTQYIDYLLANKFTPAAGQSAWSIITGNNTPNVDVTAMALAALAPYYLNDTLYPAKHTDIEAAVEGGLTYLSAQQNNSGHYGNSNSTSMVIVALASLGKDPGANTGDFTKNGKSLIDGLLAFRTSSNQLGYDNNTTANALSTEQGFRALVAYRGFQYANHSVYNLYQFGAQAGDGTALTGENNPGNVPTDPNAPKSVTVRIENIKTGETLMPETSVSVAGTHLDALKAALAANGHNPDTALLGSGYISSILGVAAGPQTGWMYALNGVLPSTMLTETRVAQGDSVVMFYVNYGGEFNLAKFDKTSADIKAGESVTVTLTGSLVDIQTMEDRPYSPVNGATVYAYDASGNQVGSSVTTGPDGKATLTFPAVGTYTISAKRVSEQNTNDLIPPLCRVTVTSPSSPSEPEPGKTITVYFTLQGLSESGKEETWIGGKTVANITEGSTVSAVIIKALEGTGYTQVGASSGYIRSVTTPRGFTLSEKYNGMQNSGWLYKVNSTLPTVGVDSYSVKNGDHVLLYFTKDYMKDPDARSMSSGSPQENLSVSSEVGSAAVIREGVAVASVDSGKIKDALKDVLETLKKSNNADTSAEVKVNVTGTAGVPAVQIELKAQDIKAIADTKNVRLTIQSGIADLTFDTKTLAGFKGTAENATVKFIVESVDVSKLGKENQKIAGKSPVFDLSVIIGDAVIHEFDGTATVFLPFTLAAGADPKTLTVYYLDGNGNPVSMENVHYDAEQKGFVFTTTHFSLFFIGTANAVMTSFADVKEKDWFYGAVRYVVQKELFTGTSASTFSPNANMTRAMLVTVLYRTEGKPAVTAVNSFTDVKSGQWYTDAIIWANEKGIVTGLGNGLFGTNDDVTREQMATILYNYAKYKGYDTAKTAELKAFSDTSAVSTWAQPAMKWTSAEGLVTGRTATTLVPKGNASRAEVATILKRFADDVAK